MAEGPPTHNPHDALFRAVFADPARAAELVCSALPYGVTGAVDWTKLERIDASFVDDDLRDHQADLVFRTSIAGRDGCIYVLLEHKAAPDRFAVLQLLRYVVRLWERWRDDEPSSQHLPLVLPFVLHNGPGPWSAPRSLQELLAPTDVPAGLLALQPSFAVAIDDLGAMDEAALHRRHLTVQALLPLLHLQQLRRTAATASLLLSWRRLHLRLLGMPGGEAILTKLYSYVAAVSDDDRSRVAAAYGRISKRTEELFMTIAERLRHEGRHEGVHEGRVAALLTLIEQRFGPQPDAVHRHIHAASNATLDVWTSRILTAASLDELLA